MDKKELLEFFQSGEFCKIFGHTMELMGKGGTSTQARIIINDQEINLSDFHQESNCQKCKFCHRQVTWLKSTGDWKIDTEGGLKEWNA